MRRITQNPLAIVGGKIHQLFVPLELLVKISLGTCAIIVKFAYTCVVRPLRWRFEPKSSPSKQKRVKHREVHQQPKVQGSEVKKSPNNPKRSKVRAADLSRNTEPNIKEKSEKDFSSTEDGSSTDYSDDDTFPIPIARKKGSTRPSSKTPSKLDYMMFQSFAKKLLAREKSKKRIEQRLIREGVNSDLIEEAKQEDQRLGAVKIQSTVRRILAKDKVSKVRHQKTADKEAIELSSAVVKAAIERAMRGNIELDLVEEAKQEDQRLGAIKIQSTVRRILAKDKVSKVGHQKTTDRETIISSAVVKAAIERAMRANIELDLVEEAKQEDQHLRAISAIKIQTSMRGRLARDEVSQIRQQRIAEDKTIIRELIESCLIIEATVEDHNVDTAQTKLRNRVFNDTKLPYNEDENNRIKMGIIRRCLLYIVYPEENMVQEQAEYIMIAKLVEHLRIFSKLKNDTDGVIEDEYGVNAIEKAESLHKFIQRIARKYYAAQQRLEDILTCAICKQLQQHQMKGPSNLGVFVTKMANELLMTTLGGYNILIDWVKKLLVSIEIHMNEIENNGHLDPTQWSHFSVYDEYEDELKSSSRIRSLEAWIDGFINSRGDPSLPKSKTLDSVLGLLSEMVDVIDFTTLFDSSYDPYFEADQQTEDQSIEEELARRCITQALSMFNESGRKAGCYDSNDENACPNLGNG